MGREKIAEKDDKDNSGIEQRTKIENKNQISTNIWFAYIEVINQVNKVQ